MGILKDLGVPTRKEFKERKMRKQQEKTNKRIRKEVIYMNFPIDEVDDAINAAEGHAKSAEKKEQKKYDPMKEVIESGDAANIIRVARVEKDMTQQKLADLLGRSRQTIIKLERDKTHFASLSVANAADLCEALDLDFAQVPRR